MLSCLLALAAAPTLIPHQGPAPTALWTLDLTRETQYPARCLAASIQGLANSAPGSSEKVFLIWDEADRFWAKWLKSEGYVQRVRPLRSLEDLIRLSRIKKAVVYDESPFHLPNVATSVAGVERLAMVGDPGLLRRYGLRPALDLRGKFHNNEEAYKWLWSRYGSRLQRGISAMTVPVKTQTHNPSQLRDYEIANSLFVYWTTGSNETKLKGADAKAEQEFVRSVLSERLPPNTPVLGYPWSGDGFGPGEWDGITFLSQTGHYLVPTDNFSNLSVWSCFPPSARSVRRPVPAARIEPGRRYCAIMMSDGDNACTFREFFREYWEGLKGKTFPVGWTMGPLLKDLAPPLFDYCAEHIPAGDTVGSGVSGVGYASMQDYRADAIAAFMNLTSERCRDLGEDWLWIMRYGPPKSPRLGEYSRTAPGEPSWAAMARLRSLCPIRWTRRTTPVIHSALDAWSPSDFDAKLDKFLSSADSPQVFSVFILNWNFKPADLVRVAEKLRARGVTIVTPEQLGDLAKEILSKR